MCALHAHLAQWKETIEWRDKAVANGDRTVWPLAELASANAWLSNLKEAKEAAAQAQNIYPGFLCRPYWVGITATIRPSTLKRIAEGLRKAAPPEGDKKTD